MSGALESSLIRSGPFFRGLCRSKLIRNDRRDLIRQTLWLVAITWGPIVVLEIVRSALHGGAFGILRNLSVHTRFLIAMPLVLVAEEALHRTSCRAISAFARCRFVSERDGEPTAPLVERATKLTGSPLLESLIAIICFVSQIGIWIVTKKAGILHMAAAEDGLTPARAWYAFFCLPLLNFLLLRLLYRWLIWAWLLRKLSAFPLRVMPTHPDKAGGLGFLVQPTLAFAVFLAALSTIMASVWADRSIADGVRVTTFTDEFSVALILGEIAAFAPLASFSSSLLHSRLEGMITYGELGLRYTRAFARRWVETPNSDGLLGTSDIQSLADLANSFAVVERMRVVPFGPRHVVVVFAAMAAPMLPLVLTEVPVHSLLQNVGRTLLGGLPP